MATSIGRSSIICAAAAWLAVQGLSTPAAAQPPDYEVLHAFQGLPGNARAPLLRASDGTLYGLTSIGGRAGIGGVFKVQGASGGGAAVTFLHEFERSEGGASSAALIEGSDGALYGTTPEHGSGGMGTIFRVTTTGAFTLLHTFTGPDGAKPTAGLLLASDGHYYGTTSEGGANGQGTLFRLAVNADLTTMHSFAGLEGSPNAALVQGPDGSLVGTSGPLSGVTFAGAVFRVNADGTFVLLYSFPAPSRPVGGLVIGSDGWFYGGMSEFLIFQGFFKVSATGEFAVVRQLFGGTGHLTARMIQGPAGHFYGTLGPAGPDDNRGSAFRLTASGELTLLHQFSPAEGVPHSGLTEAGGLLFGVTADGGAAGHGALYVMNTSGVTNTVASFTGTGGDTPFAGPVRLPNGALYGTTVRGGPLDLGTLYRIGPSGGFTTLHAFSGTDGSLPYAGLVHASDGFLYGTTSSGGGSGRGTIFRISTTGSFSTVHCFGPGDGRHPSASLMEASDGNLYGTTVLGGPHDQGTIYRLTPAGEFTTMYSFGPTGFSQYNAYPFGPLLEGADGNLYGTSYGLGGGTVYGMTPDGTVGTAARTPTRVEPGVGLVPAAPIVGSVTAGGGVLYFVSGPWLFSIPATGLLDPGIGFLLRPMTRLFVLASINPPTPGFAHSLYGTTITHPDGTGSIYRFDGVGEPVTLAILTQLQGVAPVGHLVQGPDGTLYGTTTSGGPAGRGVVFKYRTR